MKWRSRSQTLDCHVTSMRETTTAVTTARPSCQSSGWQSRVLRKAFTTPRLMWSVSFAAIFSRLYPTWTWEYVAVRLVSVGLLCCSADDLWLLRVYWYCWSTVQSCVSVVVQSGVMAANDTRCMSLGSPLYGKCTVYMSCSVVVQSGVMAANDTRCMSLGSPLYGMCTVYV